MIRVILSLVVLGTFASSAFAAEVIKVKGKSALIDLKGDPAAPGDLFYAVKPDGKRAAIIKISKVKGEKAIGKVLKGKAASGYTLELKPSEVAQKSRPKRSSDDPSSEPTSEPVGGKRSYWGGYFGFAQDSMDVNVNDFVSGTFREKASLSGNGFSAKGLFDYELFPQVWFRGTTGLEGFSVSGKTACGVNNAEACNADIYYLSFDFLGRYVFSEGSARPWIGAGVGLLFPVSKKATALDSSSISTTNVMILAGGLDWFMSPKMYIPISLEYGLLPKSDEVEATWIALRAGFAVPF
jgi:hypothetical protein